MRRKLFFLSYLAFPFLIGLCVFAYNNYDLFINNLFLLVWFLIILFAVLLFIYSRFIEPNLITIKITPIEVGFSAKIIIVSDLHLGVYRGGNFLKKIVAKINKIQGADAVLMPGDFTYYPPKNLDKLFTSFKKIKYPVLSVLGNHDSEKPGSPAKAKLQKNLEKNGVKLLHNAGITINKKNITILGLEDNYSGDDDLTKINKFSKDDNLIVLTHNPDTMLKYKNSIPDLTIAGHTHGGQIRIPFLYKKKIPCVGDFNRGLYETSRGKIFVSAGVGEVVLPMRLGVPPTIDILELK